MQANFHIFTITAEVASPLVIILLFVLKINLNQNQNKEK